MNGTPLQGMPCPPPGLEVSEPGKRAGVAVHGLALGAADFGRAVQVLPGTRGEALDGFVTPA
ncbi:MAG: hypothetical protein IT514_07445 [Burkholderiales bacterium]|nr:hypothetical protein [Burkholderiales bacterium]